MQVARSVRLRGSLQSNNNNVRLPPVSNRFGQPTGRLRERMECAREEVEAHGTTHLNHDT